MNKTVLKIANAALLIFISLFTAESYLIAVGYPENKCKTHPLSSEKPLAEFNPVLGWSYFRNRTLKNDGTFYVFNKEGYRTTSESSQTDFSKPIILIIGDSMLFGHGITFKQTFGYKLNQALENKYEILNFAVQGYGTDQMFLLLKQLFPIYKPKVVIADYIDEHLMRNVNSDRREIIPCMKFIGTKPLFEIKNGKPILKHKPMLYKVYDRPLILSLIRDLFREKIEIRTKKNGLKITLALIDEIKKISENQGSRFYFVNLSNKKNIFSNKIGPSVLGMSVMSKPSKDYTLSGDDMHPNPTGTQLMVDEFMRQFGDKLRDEY